jgi:hypothetical protein
MHNITSPLSKGPKGQVHDRLIEREREREREREGFFLKVEHYPNFNGSFAHWPCFVLKHFCPNLLFVAYQGKDIVFRFIIEYSSLRDFGPLGDNRFIFIRGFLQDDIFGLC